uniref:Uncharacterized protein n=1 Tax=Salix viminalis TaxID=40686 RepID=A0A6N2LBK8_SALVM
MDLDRHHLQRSSKDLVSCMEGCHKQLVPNLPFFEGADNIISPEKLIVDEKLKGSIKMNAKMVKETTELLYTSSNALLTEDSNQSSVASCSSNGFADSSSHNFQTPLDNASHESDAGSIELGARVTSNKSSPVPSHFRRGTSSPSEATTVHSSLVYTVITLELVPADFKLLHGWWPRFNF